MADEPNSNDATTEPATGDAADVVTDPAALTLEVERLKAASRKWEDRAKANSTAAKELEELRRSSLSDAEKAVEQARAEARTETLRSVGGRLVDAEVRAAAAGRITPEQVEAHLEALDRSRFITDDGDVDREALTAWVGRIAPPPPSGPQRPFGDVAQGARTSASTSTADMFAAAIEGSFTR